MLTNKVMLSKRKSPDYKQLSVYVRRDIATDFKVMCAKLDRDFSGIVESLIYNWLKNQADEKSNELHQFLKALAEGDKPSDAECITAAHEAGIEEELALKLRDRIFGKAK